jgi:ABC-type transporter Mla subunit MlaD
MRRLVGIAVVAAGIATGAVFSIGAGDDDGGYRVRAIFDNAVSTIEGEDVRVAGVNVGKIESLDVTRDKRAAVVLKITKDGFQDFRKDASCIIRPQSLIGEKYVECRPTQPRSPGTPLPPPLPTITAGDGQGQHLLPVEQTSSPVDLDLVNNIMRRPYAERFQLILAELGTGVAGRGQDIGEVIERANPALRETDRVLQLLASQNGVLRNLIADSDAVIAPLARDRAQVAGFIKGAAVTAQATAEHSRDLERTVERLPRFLRELRPTMQRLGELATQGAPLAADLGTAAPGINRFITQLGPFTEAATPALESLGRAADVGEPTLRHFDPIVRSLQSFGANGRPATYNLRRALESFRDTGGVERLMDYAFFQTTAINGFDQYGHYLRAGLMLNLCSTYTTVPAGECSANFTSSDASAKAAASGRDPQLAAMDAVLRGRNPDAGKRTTTATRPTAPKPNVLRLPELLLPGAQPTTTKPATGTARRPAAPAPSPLAGLLDYLLGNG